MTLNINKISASADENEIDRKNKKTRVGRPKGKGSKTVYESIRRRIIRIEWAPGYVIDEMSIVREFNVSRTPVREALIRLSSEGLVIIEPNRGAHVAPMEIDDVRSFFELLDLIQRAATRWAALRRTTEQIEQMQHYCDAFNDAVLRDDPLAQSESNMHFHRIIAEASHNSYITDTYCHLLTKGIRLSHLSLTKSKDISPVKRQFNAWMMEEHQLMVDYIRAGDADQSEIVAHQHLVKFKKNVMDYINLSNSMDISIISP